MPDWELYLRRLRRSIFQYYDKFKYLLISEDLAREIAKTTSNPNFNTYQFIENGTATFERIPIKIDNKLLNMEAIFIPDTNTNNLKEST